MTWLVDLAVPASLWAYQKPRPPSRPVWTLGGAFRFDVHDRAECCVVVVDVPVGGER